MTTFTYPVLINRADTYPAYTSAAGRVNFSRRVTISTAQTGTAVGTTTIPLFIAPAGAYFQDAFLDIRTAYDNTAGVNITIGTAAIPATIFAATTVNTTGRRTYAGSAAQVSANNIVLTADTTIQAIVSITTSAVTEGNVVFTLVMA